MRKKLILLFFMLISFSVFAKISLKSVTGFVQVKKDENADWFVPKIGHNLQKGNIIYTGFNSTAVIQTDNAKIEVKPLSQMSISSLVATDNKVATDIYLKYGKIKADVDVQKDVQTLFKVRSANSTASVRGTIFSFGEDDLFVEAGTVLFLSNDGILMYVQKNENAFIKKLHLANSPFQNLWDSSYVNTLPTGMSMDELGNIRGIGGKIRIRGKAKVVIRIRVIR